MLSFKQQTIEKTTSDIAGHLPNGRVWAGKYIPDSNLHKLIKGLAAGFVEVQNQIQHLSEEFDINLTQDLLPDWETSVGIPDECTGRLMDLESRRKAILRKLTKIPIVDIAEMELFISEIIGQDVMLVPGVEAETFPYTLPIILSSTNPLFKIYLTYENSDVELGFPYSLPFRLGSVQEALIRCVMNKIIPANVVLEIRRSY